MAETQTPQEETQQEDQFIVFQDDKFAKTLQTAKDGIKNENDFISRSLRHYLNKLAETGENAERILHIAATAIIVYANCLEYEEQQEFSREFSKRFLNEVNPKDLIGVKAKLENEESIVALIPKENLKDLADDEIINFAKEKLPQFQNIDAISFEIVTSEQMIEHLEKIKTKVLQGVKEEN